jgi:hypothetical protein
MGEPPTLPPPPVLPTEPPLPVEFPTEASGPALFEPAENAPQETTKAPSDTTQEKGATEQIFFITISNVKVLRVRGRRQRAWHSFLTRSRVGTPPKSKCRSVDVWAQEIDKTTGGFAVPSAVSRV